MTDRSLATAFLDASDIAVSLSDPMADDNPLIWVNQAFLELTGYESEQCLGRNCRFLQGPMTRNTDVARIATSLRNNRVERTDILNYRASGQPFHNAVYVGPVRTPTGSVQLHFGLQWDVTTSERRAGVQLDSGPLMNVYRERLALRRTLSLALRDVIVKRSSLLGGEALGYALVERLVATVRPDQFPLDGDVSGHTSIRTVLEFILSPYSAIYDISVSLTGSEQEMSPDLASALALVLHELVSQAHAASAHANGSPDIDLHWTQHDDAGLPMVEFNWTERQAAREGTIVQIRAPDMAYVLMSDALACVNGTIEESRTSTGREVTVRVPRDRLPAR